MKNAAYYEALDAADAAIRKRETPRRSPFKVSKSTTAKVKGYIVTFKVGGDARMLRVQSGYATWASTSQAVTVFRTRADAQAGIAAYMLRYSHSCRLTGHAIVPIGDLEVYHG